MPKYIIEETTLHHSRYEVDADSPEEAERLHLSHLDKSQLTEEFWGETTREIKESE